MDTREAIRNFTLGAGYQATELLFAGIIAFPVYALCYHYRLFELELNWLTGLLTFLGVDFCFYWMHRASHRMRWFWAAHVVHHSSERMNFSTAMRQNATNIFNGGWAFYLPLALLGFNPVWIGITYALSLVYQFFVHTTLVGQLPGWIEQVFNTPSHHRVHHGRNPDYIDRNYPPGAFPKSVCTLDSRIRGSVPRHDPLRWINVSAEPPLETARVGTPRPNHFRNTACKNNP